MSLVPQTASTLTLESYTALYERYNELFADKKAEQQRLLSDLGEISKHLQRQVERLRRQKPDTDDSQGQAYIEGFSIVHRQLQMCIGEIQHNQITFNEPVEPADLQDAYDDLQDMSEAAERQMQRQKREVLLEVLQVYDAFARLISVQASNVSMQSSLRLFTATDHLFINMLSRYAVTVMSSQRGQPPDLALCEIIGTDAQTAADGWVVIQELTPAYMLNGKLLRKASVILGTKES